jgi:hypothetical protein
MVAQLIKNVFWCRPSFDDGVGHVRGVRSVAFGCGFGFDWDGCWWEPLLDGRDARDGMRVATEDGGEVHRA